MTLTAVLVATAALGAAGWYRRKARALRDQVVSLKTKLRHADIVKNAARTGYGHQATKWSRLDRKERTL